jgi:hypothetical protein
MASMIVADRATLTVDRQTEEASGRPPAKSGFAS